MRTEYELSKEQPQVRKICAYCGRQWYAALVRTCPERDRPICAYCCRSCGYRYATAAGQGCRAAEKRKG